MNISSIQINYTAGRTQGLGYDGSAEETRKGYTGYEKDNESGLDYAQARYYNSTHGRFTSVDPLIASAQTANPQTFNRYSYVINDPLNLVDPYGLSPCSAEFSYSDCGGDNAFWGKSSNDFGDDRAFYDLTFRDMPDAAVRSLDLHMQRVSNDADGYGFITHDQVFTDVPFWIWWGTNSDGSVWTRFDLNINVRGSNGRPRSGGLNDNGKDLIKEMGRWGPILQKTTTTMMIVDGAIIAAPYAAEAIVWGGSDAFENMLPNTLLSRGQIARRFIGKAGTKYLGEVFKNGTIPQGLTRQMVLAYIEIAKRTIAEGLDKGAQLPRIQQLQQILKKLK